MSVNEKMTSIADKTRELLGVDGKMGLDAVSDNLGRAVDESDTQAGIIRQIKTVLEDRATGIELPTLVNEGQASDLVYGKQLIDQDGNIVTGTVENGKNVYTAVNGEVDAVHKEDSIFFGHTFETDAIFRKGSRTEFSFWDLGTASRSQVVEGYTFTSEFGLKETGTLKENSSYAEEATTAQSADGKKFYVESGQLSQRTLLKRNGKIGIYVDPSQVGDFGTATAADVAKGKTFTSAEGYALEGEREESGGAVITFANGVLSIE